MVSGFYEKRLNCPLIMLLALVGLLCGRPVHAQEALAVGQVRDAEGSALAGARVRAVGPSGSSLGEGEVDVAGGFAFEVSGAPARLLVRCAYCAPVDVLYRADVPAVIIVQRYRAVAQRDPSAADYAVLPYDRIADAIALRPFVVELTRGTTVLSLSDRGLGAGYGLLFDAGVAAYDRSSGSMNLWSLPARYVADVHVADNEQAYRYGSYGGGGTFFIDPISEGRPSARVDGGTTQDARVNLAGRSFAWLSGTSDDATATAARSDARFLTRIGAGDLILGGSVSRSAVGVPRPFVRWSTHAASARYATSVGAFRAETAIALDSGETITATRSAWSSNALDARIARDGTVPFEVGYTARRTRNDTGAGLIPTQAQNALYVHAATGHASTHVEASIAAFSIAIPAAHANAVTPAIAIDQDLTRAFRLHLAATGSLQAVPPAFLNADAGGGLEVLRSSTYAGELQWGDARRASGALIAFSEGSSASRRYGGWGARFAYQLTPQLALRTWALRGSATVSSNAAEYGLSAAGASALSMRAREVAWLTYDRLGGVRIDAIYSRNGPQNDRHLNADLLAPLTATLRVYAGTSYVNLKRRYEIGLRF